MNFERGDRVTIEGVVTNVSLTAQSHWIQVKIDGTESSISFQPTGSNVRILSRRPLRIGDPVRIGELRGKITGLEPSGAYVIILAENGIRHVLPSSDLERDE